MNQGKYSLKYQPIIIVCLSILFSAHSISAQNVDSYQKQRALLSDHIKMLDATLQGKQKEKITLSKNYQLLEKKIEKHHQLQETIGQEMNLIDSILAKAQGDLSNFYILKERRKEQLRQTIRRSYYQRLMSNPWLQWLSADNLKEAILKSRYNAQIEDYVSDNIHEINRLSTMVRDTITFLSQIQQEKFQLLAAEEYNLTSMQSEQQRSDQLLKEIQNEESRIKEQLYKQKKESERLNKIISDLIKKEEAAASAKLSTNKEGLSGAFENNKKNLSWPVAKGVVTEKFGIRQHPTLKNVKTENLGIDMICPENTKVTSIYDGTVLIVTYQPPYENIAIINHGDYTTAYYYLKETYVEKGRKVSAGEVIGSLKNIEGGSDFHFEIWYRQKQVDPELWLKKR